MAIGSMRGRGPPFPMAAEGRGLLPAPRRRTVSVATMTRRAQEEEGHDPLRGAFRTRDGVRSRLPPGAARRAAGRRGRRALPRAAARARPGRRHARYQPDGRDRRRRRSPRSPRRDPRGRHPPQTVSRQPNSRSRVDLVLDSGRATRQSARAHRRRRQDRRRRPAGRRHRPGHCSGARLRRGRPGRTQRRDRAPTPRRPPGRTRLLWRSDDDNPIID